MGLHLRTGSFSYEVGRSDFLASFFDTIEIRLTKGLFGKKYPTVLNEFYNGNLKYENLERAEKELIDIQKRLKKHKPSKVVWDKFDLNKMPPWEGNISSHITDLSNYFVTSDGKDLFKVIFQAIETAKSEKSGITIE
ncbi:immunity 70 family protein [Zobellia galactanivorans]|uniref:immunity 70 family protein n=1 Tax=Zobellia galactanivorans (strain DSM 12802 / CCUG 47099 / CIP 106680 / NCIMB 13871 / Dsij) TaxID=63186 RepID=UPI001C067A9B|nr:immunity 70 family protein [Zobellia galactanivorans]MBU3026023.1 immunity 70 family protein [Zobellia galactanivorans]